MEELKNKDRLSSREYWDSVLLSANLPRICTRRSYHYRITMDFIDEFLKNRKCETLLEVGCGSSGWLPYFALKYKLQISGLDYSEPGCTLARKNLEMQGIPYDTIICKDIFEPDCTLGKKYDVIFSYGVIEHFENPGSLIQIFAGFLNPGGLVISLVPNLNGLMGTLSRYFVRDILEMHRVMDANELRAFHEINGLTTRKSGYAGTFTLSVLPLVKSKRWVYKPGSIQRKIMSFILETIDKLACNFFKLTRIDVPTRYFSPYIICVAQKDRS
jgi:2-polyprenyl-3-methyl-5-hydroxy-6-metoxy-1,4-benzoquinol methylase